MSRKLLASRNGALLFAGMTMLGAIVLVGDGESAGVLETTTGRLTDQRGQMADQVQSFENAPPASPIILPYSQQGPVVSSDALGPEISGLPVEPTVPLLEDEAATRALIEPSRRPGEPSMGGTGFEELH